MKDERLMVLVDAFLDGGLSPEEKRELEKMLLESDAARRQFWQRASMHGWTYSATKLAYSEAPAKAERREIRRTFFDASDVLSWFTGWKKLVGFAAACLAVIATLWIMNPSADDSVDELAEETGEPVARTNTIAMLTHGAGVVWSQGSGADLEIGALLDPGPLHLKSGVARIQFHSGASMTIEGPAEFELLTPQETRLHSGKLTAHVPQKARGFKVHLADLTVTDLGTEFGVSQSPAQPPEVHVFEGEVELGLPVAAGVTPPAPQVLTNGQSVKVQTGEVRPVPSNRPLFVSDNELFRRETTELQARHAAWRQANGGLDSDPAMLVHYNFEGIRTNNRVANRARKAPKGTTGANVGADRAEGRWPGKSALEFKGPDDRVKLTVPGRHQSLTYMAWVRVDSLQNQNNSIALTERRKPGELHLQINRAGRLTMSVRQPPPPKDQKGPSWDGVGSSKPVVSPDWLGRWVHLAAVYDGPGKMMSLYANGQLVGSKAIKKPLELELGAVELGNWSRRVTPTSTNTKRDFNGRMDEFTLMGRALSADEINRQYELGKPRETVLVASGPRSSATKP